MTTNLNILGKIIKAGVVANIPKLHKDTMSVVRGMTSDPDWPAVQHRDLIVQYEPPTTRLRAPLRSLALWRYLVSHGIQTSDITAGMVK